MSVRRGPVRVALSVLLLVGGWSVASARPGIAQSAPPATVHIVAAPAGSGSACTPPGPCSIWTAQSLARRSAGRVNVDVDLEAGTYTLDHPLVFSASDSGTSTHPVVYEAATGAHPVLSGGIPVTNWTKSAGGLWERARPRRDTGPGALRRWPAPGPGQRVTPRDRPTRAVRPPTRS